MYVRSRKSMETSGVLNYRLGLLFGSHDRASCLSGNNRYLSIDNSSHNRPCLLTLRIWNACGSFALILAVSFAQNCLGCFVIVRSTLFNLRYSEHWHRGGTGKNWVVFPSSERGQPSTLLVTPRFVKVTGVICKVLRTQRLFPVFLPASAHWWEIRNVGVRAAA